MVKQQKRLRGIMIALLVVFLIACFAPVGAVLAEEYSFNEFEKTEVMADLKSIKDFDFSKYPPSRSKKPEVVQFVEYCYSSDKTILDNYYGLYLYVYNPVCWEILPIGNSVNIATSFDGEGKGRDYEKKDIKLISQSPDKLFLKFKIVDSTKMLDAIINPDARRYSFASFEMNCKPVGGTAFVDDYKIGGNYLFSGYTLGCGVDLSVSDISCIFTSEETVSLKLEDSVYRTGQNEKGPAYRTQVNSVAFAVPDYFFEKYGKLQKIKAEWYEYRTEPIVILSETGMYNDIKMSQNYPLNSGASEVNDTWGLFADYQYANGSTFEFGSAGISFSKHYDALHNLFFYGGGNSGDKDRSLAKYTLPASDLKEYLFGYPITEGEDFIQTRTKKISNKVLNDNVGEGRKAGYNLLNIDASDTFNLMALQSGAMNAWDNFWSAVNGSGFPAHYALAVKDLNPIFVVEDEKILKGDSFTLSNNLMWEESKVSWLKLFDFENRNSGKKTVIFRPGVFDYFSTTLHAIKNGMPYAGDGVGDSCEGIVAEQNVMLDFDVVELTFSENGKFTPIGVVAKPIDIVGSVEPPLKTPLQDGWDKFLEVLKWVGIGLACVAGLVLLGLFFPFIKLAIVFLCKCIKWLFIALWWLISAPFKGIARLFGGGK